MSKSNIDKLLEDCINHWTPEELIEHQKLVSDGRPVRYYARLESMGLWRSVVSYLRTGLWRRTETFFDPVFPWQPGYEEAPFESGWVFHTGP